MDANKLAFINKTESNYLDYVLKSRNDNIEAQQELIRQLASVARNEAGFNTEYLVRLQDYKFDYADRFIKELLTGRNSDGSAANIWTENDTFIKHLVNQNTVVGDKRYLALHFIVSKLTAAYNGSLSFINYVKNIGLSDEDIIGTVFQMSWKMFETNDGKPTLFKHYLLENLKDKSSFLGLKKEKGLASIIDSLIQTGATKRHQTAILRLLLNHAPNAVTDIQRYMVQVNNSYYPKRQLLISTVGLLLDFDALKYESDILKALEQFTDSIENLYLVYRMLDGKIPNKYQDKIEKIGETSLNQFINLETGKYYYFNHLPNRNGNIQTNYSKYLINKDKTKAKQRILQFTEESDFLTEAYLKFLDEEFGTEAIPFYFNALKKNPGIVDKSYRSFFQALFELLNKHTIEEKDLDKIIQFGIDNKPKKYRVFASQFLEKRIDTITPKAQKLLEGKVDERIFGAMMLQSSTNPEVIKQLLQLTDTERSDDTRDILLDALSDFKFKKPFTLSEVKEMVAIADQRKKLSKWTEKWVDETNLPKLYWQNGEALTEAEIRFLFYRSKRAKGINSDIEARQLIQLIDKSKSDKFASKLIDVFKESNYDNKLKYYVVLAGLLGGDSILAKLNTVFNGTVTNKRYRLAAMMVGAIAMVGSDKALRIVDMIARKFSNKRPQIRNGAIEALDAAAAELNISLDQLADRIIPDFGFENNYKTFVVEGETYRAFVSNEFKLHYFNDDNKLRKSIPKGTDKAIVTELKTIDKEIREVVKNQSGRLENYLISERKWSVAEWQKYYFGNPIMLVYVQRLLWGVYTPEGDLANVFYCDEDLELYNVDDDEVILDNAQQIGIVHPLHMTTGLLEKWKEKIYDSDLEFEFEIVNREITHKTETELEFSTTRILHDTDIPRGADYVAGFLMKRGWHKESGDGGSLWFSKINKTNNIIAMPYIEGPAAYYLGGTTPATVFEVSFYAKDQNEKVLIKDVPSVFYSEVVADLKALINA
ncbi:MAG: DUF4132 domain-containing protein [Aestuariibaculum sp.]